MGQEAPVASRRKRNPLAYAIGTRKGALVILARDPSGTPKHPRFMIRCDCGSEYVVAQSNLANARACKKCRKGGRKPKYAGMRTQTTPLYHSWSAMRHRCRAKHDPKMKRWAGRGITVCPEWESSFEAFKEWSLSNGYAPGLSLDRVNVDRNYGPDNCEWVTKSINSKRARAEYQFIRRKSDPFSLQFYLPIEALFGSV